MSTLAEATALAATGLFAGASLFISAAVVPSAAEEAEERDQEKTPKSNIDPVLLFQRVYPKAARMQAPLALVGGAASLYAFLNSPDVDETFVTDTTSGLPWLYSSVLMGSIVPYTLALMMPLNNQLMKAEALRKDPEWKRSRLAEWASLHAVRTAASCVALGIIAYKISKKVV